MTRSRLMGLLLAVAAVALVAYIATNTYWDDIPIPTPPKGEAITNPFYTAQRFAQALGARARRERSLVLPSTQSVVVMSAWHWDLSAERQAAIQQWVETGGRLVVDGALSGNRTLFEQWAGIESDFNEVAADAHYEDHDEDTAHERCTPVQETLPGPGRTYLVCELDFSFVKTARPVQWAIKDDAGDQALRVAVGRGSVTVINAVPFTRQSLLEGDHAPLFVAATQLRRGDEVLFLSEDDHPSLLVLLWRFAAPAVGLSLAVVALFVWRGAVRFGPPAAWPEPRRRSMAEQIRGSGRFVLQHGDGAPLHAASVRALSEVARRRIPAYARLSRPQRAAALGRATGMDGEAILSAMESLSKRRVTELPNTLGLLETARRQLLNPGD